ncbi:HVO_A0556 family zinc finger protein [Natrinema salaciae]|nr:HVO_A0556 family zinc finger protein [Natrinema salaciae]
MDDPAAENPVLDLLEGTSCAFCDGGTLVRGTYHGNAAVICDDCHTPGAQLW